MALNARSSTPLAWERRAVPGDLPVSVTLGIEVEKQAQEQWCWAAIGSALTHFYPGGALTQAEVAARVLEKDLCLISPWLCDEPMDMAFALAQLGFAVAGGTNGKVPFLALAQRLAAKQPVVLRVLLPPNGTPHLVLLKGYRQTDGWLDIEDPADTRFPGSFFDAVDRGHPKLGTWTNSYWTKG